MPNKKLNKNATIDAITLALNEKNLKYFTLNELHATHKNELKRTSLQV